MNTPKPRKNAAKPKLPALTRTPEGIALSQHRRAVAAAQERLEVLHEQLAGCIRRIPGLYGKRLAVVESRAGRIRNEIVKLQTISNDANSRAECAYKAFREAFGHDVAQNYMCGLNHEQREWAREGLR